MWVKNTACETIEGRSILMTLNVKYLLIVVLIYLLLRKIYIT